MTQWKKLWYIPAFLWWSAFAIDMFIVPNGAIQQTVQQMMLCRDMLTTIFFVLLAK